MLIFINDKLIEKESPLNQYGLYIMGEVCITTEITARNKRNTRVIFFKHFSLELFSVT
jgi:hypothetical protein